jgi:hypothetical protein
MLRVTTCPTVILSEAKNPSADVDKMAQSKAKGCVDSSQRQRA